MSLDQPDKQNAAPVVSSVSRGRSSRTAGLVVCLFKNDTEETTQICSCVTGQTVCYNKTPVTADTSDDDTGFVLD